MTNAVGRYVGLIIVTVVAAAVAIMVTVGGWGQNASKDNGITNTVAPPTPVEVVEVRLETIEITDRYSGMIRPWERFSVGFEIPGRVNELGINQSGAHKGLELDDGDEVSEKQLLARLEDNIQVSQLAEAREKKDQALAQMAQAVAQVAEAAARAKKAAADLERSEKLKQQGSGAITDAQYDADLANVEVARAQMKLAEAQTATAKAQEAGADAQIQTVLENLKDTELFSPVDGVISKRLINAGESVNAHQTIVEIIQVQQVLLVVGVPEAYVAEIREGQPVRVQLLARDRFRRRRSHIEGRVHQVAQAADRTTGLFEVEIAISNRDGRWRPGLIAVADIVLREVEGFRVPLQSTMVLKHEMALRDKELSKDRELLEYLEDEKNEVLFLYAVDQDKKARRLVLREWIEQDSDAVILDLAPQRRTVVKRGQHRLVEGRKVVVVEGTEAATDSRVAVRAEDTAAAQQPTDVEKLQRLERP